MDELKAFCYFSNLISKVRHLSCHFHLPFPNPVDPAQSNEDFGICLLETAPSLTRTSWQA